MPLEANNLRVVPEHHFFGVMCHKTLLAAKAIHSEGWIGHKCIVQIGKLAQIKRKYTSLAVDFPASEIVNKTLPLSDENDFAFNLKHAIQFSKDDGIQVNK